MSTAGSRPAVAIVPEGWTPKAGSDPVLRDQHGLIGAQVSRLDGPLKVRGEARFAAEYVMEGMVYAALRVQHDRSRSHHDPRHQRCRGRVRRRRWS